MTTVASQSLPASPPPAPATRSQGDDVLLGGVSTAVHGTVAPGFEPVRDAFVENLVVGRDVGASAAVFIEGEPVVDLWGGYDDTTYTREWQRDTIVNGFSSTKTMTALSALLLADQGEL